RPFGEMDMPRPAAAPADELARPNALSIRDSRRHVPVVEVTDLQASVHADVMASGSVNIPGTSPLERVHGLAQAARSARVRMKIVDADVDPEVVVARAFVPFGTAGVQEAGAHGVLSVQRPHGPATKGIGIPVAESPAKS